MRLRTVLSVFAAALLVGACESGPSETGAASGTGQTQTSTAPAAAIGWGEVVKAAGNQVFFDFDMSDLKPRARQTVEAWATYLKGNPQVTMTVEGHADERGTREYNLALGDRRASAVKNYLAALGVQGNRVRTISYGKEKPADPGHNDTSWAATRRGVAVPNSASAERRCVGASAREVRYRRSRGTGARFLPKSGPSVPPFAVRDASTGTL